MSTLTGVDLSNAPDALGVLAFRGPDAARFLQGQLSADVEKLPLRSSAPAGLHNPQGRVIALLWLARTSADEFLAVLPLELLAAVEQRLRKFILRSKVRVEDSSTAFRVIGTAAAPDSEPRLIEIPYGPRSLLVIPRDVGLANTELGDARAEWERDAVTNGIPQIYAATSESFVAQMLNLDLLGAISFDKGCYTGQEVIARAHYRGRVKRRVQRWHSMTGPLAPGSAVRDGTGRRHTVVSSAAAMDGGYDLLAVGAFAPADANENTESADDSGVIEVSGPLPLPYALPE